MKRLFCLIAVIAVIAGILAGVRLGAPGRLYRKGVSLREQGRWDEAVEAFTDADGYRDAAEKICETKYQKASAFMEAGETDSAYAVYLQIAGYRDVDDILSDEARFRSAAQKLDENTAPFQIPGTIVCFGRCEQDNDLRNGPEPIEWVVLERREDSALLVSRYGLDCQPYHAKRAIVTWEKSSIRHWLNSDFLGACFDAQEQQAIIKGKVDNSRAQSYEKHGGDSGSDTQDKVFLLSYAEACRYFQTDEDRQLDSTDYAKAQGAYTNPVNGKCWWWLRSIGNAGTCAANVHYSGVKGDFLVNVTYATVRPAIRVDLRSECFLRNSIDA